MLFISFLHATNIFFDSKKNYFLAHNYILCTYLDIMEKFADDQ